MLLANCQLPGGEQTPGDAAIPKAWGTAVLIETDNSGGAREPQIAFDAAGNAMVVWIQSDGMHESIWSNRYTAGYGWGTASVIELDDGNVSAPRIACFADGNALAVWIQNDGTWDSAWANYYTVGFGWGTAVLIETDNAGDVSGPWIAADAKGNALAVWHLLDDTRYDVWSNRYTAGSGWGTAALLETDDTGNAYGPRIAIDAGGNALAVWSQDDGLRNYIRFNRYTAGSGWGASALVEIDDTGNAVSPEVAFDAGGKAMVVWAQSDGTHFNIWSNRYTAGSGWGTAALVETDNSGDAVNLKVAVDSEGNALAVWNLDVGPRFNVWSNRYTAGSGWGTAALLETDDSGSALYPQVGFDANGNALAVWFQDDGARFNIRSKRYTPGSGWGATVFIETDNAGDATYPQFAIDAGGDALAVWSQSDNVRSNIWANRFR